MIPVDFEMIENEPADAEKQDCELNASKRLLERVKKNYPRLRILLSADALYANQQMMELCEDKHWHYIIRFKQGCVDSMLEEYEEHRKTKIAKVLEEVKIRHGKKEITQNYTYVNDLSYEGHTVNIGEIEEICEERRTVFMFITDMRISERNIKEIIKFGRKRWKIENKGFNDEKHRGFAMCHAYSYDENAVKCHYALLLVAHLIMQLLEHYMKTQGNRKKIKDLGKEIKEALRFAHLNAQDYVEILRSIQIRTEVSC